MRLRGVIRGGEERRGVEIVMVGSFVRVCRFGIVKVFF